ncbi:MAG: PH domain-containing protein [Gammaproteobacteria bacterium]|nr:PH domain-containing protein [Gammaproteobacteria bacterium]MDE2348075.1 PH domain-containing protein [Gammaproteobacteria bacterium]
MSHDDFAFEPVRGLPAPLPRGESLLWQGSPHWWRLAVDAYHLRKVAAYFLALFLWRFGVQAAGGSGIAASLEAGVPMIVLGTIASLILGTLASFSARSAVFSITTARIVMRHGIAVPTTMNVPFELLQGAALKRRGDSGGDLAMRLRDDQRIGYLISWPYVRPGRLAHPEPCFRALADAGRAAKILADAMIAHSGPATVRRESPPAPVAPAHEEAITA